MEKGGRGWRSFSRFETEICVKRKDGARGGGGGGGFGWGGEGGERKEKGTLVRGKKKKTSYWCPGDTGVERSCFSSPSTSKKGKSQ